MRRRTIAGITATVAAVGLLIGVGVVWPGLDAQETPEVDASVWALQTGDGRRYARVNTSIGELDTVRTVSNPTEVVQTGDAAYLFADSYSKLTRIDEALPVDLDEEALEGATSTPAGTTTAVTAGEFVAYRTDTGAVFAGRLGGDTRQIEPDAGDDDEDAPQYTAEAIAVDGRGILFAYSQADAAVLRYDIAAAEVRGRDALSAEIAAPAITAAGDTWAVVDGEDGTVRLSGVDEPVTTEATGSVVVGRPDPDGADVYVASETGLVRVPADGEEPETVVSTGATVLGIPAQPVVHDGEVFAAWLAAADAGGVLWSSRTGQTPLDYGEESLGDQRRPVFVATDESVILNETRSGWVWSVPDGVLVPSSQDWSLDERSDPAAVPSDEQLAVVVDPKPPVAENDAFGVRAGGLATLPVLLNDHDPNEDVLSIDPASVTGLDPGFGAVSITDDGQRFSVRVAPEATGTATFQYAVTDGTTADGFVSPPATVTLTVSDPAGNAAPEWCGVEGCLQPWPTPEVALGGTVTVPVLPGWVDPDGDPLLLLGVENVTGVGSVAATPSGEVVYQHSDDGSGAEQLIDLMVTVADTAGGTTTRQLLVRVSPAPALTVQSFAVVDSVDTSLTVDVASHVTGTSGALALTSVRVLDDAPASATIVDGTTTFDLATSTPGTYRVDLTVTDGISEATGTVRVTVLAADAAAALATSPVVAFVRPQEDATLDVFAAVSNPTRRVLLLSDLVANADTGATLSVDAVGQNFLRVSGSTASGAPGRLGAVTYTVSDGTADEGASVQGEATVYLLPPAPELAPIAVDDRVVVRAGAQIDIPVLDNDVSPAGGRPTIDPASVVSSSGHALAFASGGVLRYLAPSEAGDYAVEYSVYTTGTPSLTDTATVRVTVLPDDANRAPQPDTLEGRVLSGQTTTIEFDGFGMDPDGDVVTLDRIVAQPEAGAATVSADGSAIVYSSVPGHSGQVVFRYRAVDSSGEAGEGTVRIGVLDTQANPSPVTFTDYVQVQAGEGNTIRVSPLANDIDPVGGALRLTSVRPDLPETLADGSANAEYTRIAERVGDLGDTEVVIEAGEEPATMSFLYDVESDSGNTARGLIVVKVVRESVPDYPVVSDTSLTVEDRDEFTGGVDVISGKATWAGGDVGDLAVELWGSPTDVVVDGWELSGELPSTARLIPFSVTGGEGDAAVTTYAFLRVPGDDDVALALRAGTSAQEVDELQSVSWDMSGLVALPRNATLEVGEDVRASGSRADARCVPESGGGVRYDAGAGGPWTDACIVPVRIAGTEEWTYLSVPVLVTALDPQPEIRAASLTVGPGETATFDLQTMTTWQLRDDWDGIQYSLDYSGGAFEVSLDGSIVTVTGADAAVPGTETAALIGVTSHAAVAPARLILRVGAAPSTLPQGGSVTQQCSQAAGTSCTIEVIGAGGEVNPLPGTPLELVDVRPTGACRDVDFRLGSARTVIASWATDAPGATCSASFSVRDAQDRTTSSQRDGRILLDLQGFPQAPSSVAQTGYDDGTVTLRVEPGAARQAYPTLEGFVVRYNGESVARCDTSGACGRISAPNGERRVYEVVSLNDVGESRSSVRTTAWAYDTPAAPRAVSASPVVTSDAAGGVVALTITGVDAAETGYLEISSQTGGTQQVTVARGQTTIQVPIYRLNSNTRTRITVVPYSRFDLPAGLGGTPSGQSVSTVGNGIGMPQNLALSLASRTADPGMATLVAQGSASRNGDGSEVRYGFVNGNGRCSTDAGGGTATFTVEDGVEYTIRMCVESWYDGERFGRAETEGVVRAVQPANAPQGWVFTVGGEPTVADNGVQGGRAEWRIRDLPTSAEAPPRSNEPSFNVDPLSVRAFGSDPGLSVKYCHTAWGTCSEPGAVTPAKGSAPYQIAAEWRVSRCVGGEALQAQGTGGDVSFAINTTARSIRYLDSRGWPIITLDPTVVPWNAARVEGIPVKASVGSWGLSDVNTEMSGKCYPTREPRPDNPPDDDDDDDGRGRDRETTPDTEDRG